MTIPSIHIRESTDNQVKNQAFSSPTMERIPPIEWLRLFDGEDPLFFTHLGWDPHTIGFIDAARTGTWGVNKLQNASLNNKYELRDA